MREFWDTRYSEKEFAYGELPNDFLALHYQQIKPEGNVLLICDGEGRNSFFLAQKGFNVTGVDSSEVGLEKARSKAKAHGLDINYINSDMSEYNLGHEKWDAIISIFAHVPPTLRKKIHHEVEAALKPRGLFILEAYRPQQLEFKTGGPSDPAMMMSLETLKQELPNLTVDFAEEPLRVIHEGKYHHGQSAVVQFIGRKK